MDDERFKAVKQRFFMMRNGVIAETLKKSGIGYQVVFGVNIPQLKEIARELGPDNEMATLLWNDKRCRESQLLAPMMMHPETMTVDRGIVLLRESPTAEVTDNLCHSLLRHMPEAWKIVDKASSDTSDKVRYGAVRLSFNLINHDAAKAGKVAKKEFERDCPLTRGLCVKLIDEADFLNHG